MMYATLAREKRAFCLREQSHTFTGEEIRFPIATANALTLAREANETVVMGTRIFLFRRRRATMGEMGIISQYRLLKRNFQDSVLFVRIGDFYEAFDEDAKIAAKICQVNAIKNVCGFPYANAQHYFDMLIKSGRKVAIAEQ